MHTKEKNKMRYGRRNQYPGNGPFSDLPPYQRPGYLYGGGRGRGYWGTDPTKCARFPWLQRWWWANPDAPVDPNAGVAPVAPRVMPQAPTNEREFLESQLDYLTREMEDIKSRIKELGETKTQ
jgi:hypothetical protein